MCINSPECQHCRTCGLRRYRFWSDENMHPRGCEEGAPSAALCTIARDHAATAAQMVRDMPEACNARSGLSLCLLQIPQIDPEAASMWRSAIAEQIAENANCSGEADR